MDSKRVYEELIAKAKNREIDTENYYEEHHIIPQCIGGTDIAENLILLTAREHFIAHLLLERIYGGRLIHAAHMMSNMRRYKSRKYEWLRERHAQRLSAIFKGRIVSEETRQKISDSKKGKTIILPPKTKSHVENWKKSRIENGSFAQSDLHRHKTSVRHKGEGNNMYGKNHTDDARAKMSQANKIKVSCPYCQKVGGIAIMKRWHFERCRHK